MANAMLATWAIAVEHGEQAFDGRRAEVEGELAQAVSRAEAAEAAHASQQAELAALRAQLEDGAGDALVAREETRGEREAKASALEKLDALTLRLAADADEAARRLDGLRDSYEQRLQQQREAHAAAEASFREELACATERLEGVQRHVIGAADGVAFGAGFSLLLLADIVLLSDRARLCMAFQRIGLLPDCGALFTLPRAVGLQRAKELIFSAREIGAAEAQGIGLALEVLSPDALLPRAMETARAFCGASEASTPLVKRPLDASFQSDLETMFRLRLQAKGWRWPVATWRRRLGALPPRSRRCSSGRRTGRCSASP
ncbi:enoyl-CoA hydratase/isomerase family protein [Polaromonas sp. P1(28)-13]|nr:enoyl-CoA hydratase/isomerase family protein [Polaromonas sp. P1(28)-13]